MRSSTCGALGLAAALALPGCHLGDSGNPMAPAQSTQRGALLGAPTQTGSYSSADLLALLPLNALGKELLQLAPAITCTVTAWHFEYATVGGRGEATTASGALLAPSGSGSSCQGPRPVLIYDHGTSINKAYDLANLSDQGNGEGLLLAAVFASQGYIVVAPNYAGYDTSTLGYHPYLNADQQSKDSVDALTAARSALGTAGATASSKLYVTGYSQGGFAALATQRALEAQGTAVTAAAPMSGPYALAALGDAIFLGQVNGSAVVNFTLIATSYQHSYGNLYSSTAEVFAPKYANGIDSLLPSAATIGSLESQGKLPTDTLFSSTPPAPQYAAITPATVPSQLAPVFARGFGSDYLVNNSYRLAFLQDQQAHPDGGYPTTTTDLPSSTATQPLRQDFARNDLRGFTPKAPLLLCGGSSDPVVFFFNTQLLQGYLAKAAPSAPVTVLDVDSAPVSGDPYADLKLAFAAAKESERLQGGAIAVFEAYHATLVAPFCLTAVKSFFDQHSS